MRINFLRQNKPLASAQKISPTWNLSLKLLLAAILSIYGLVAKVVAEPLPANINFQHLLENKDITLGEVQTFLQDKQGFMWIGGGGGLIRYDGYEFKFVQQTVHAEHSTEKKPIGVVNGLFEDSEKTLWVSTRTGLFYYNPQTEQLIALEDNASAPLPISTTGTFKAIELPSGEIIVPSLSGIFIVNKTTKAYSAIVPDTNKPDSLHGKRTPTAFVDTGGVLWLGTEAGLERVDWASKKFTLIKPYPEHPELVPPNSVTDIASDNNGGIWVATFEGLVHFDLTTQKSIRYINDPKDPNSISGKDIAAVTVDSTGAVWVASDGGGVSVFEKSPAFPEGRFINHRAEPGRPGSLNSNQVRTVYEDRIGDIWVGNYPSGINYFDRTSAAITTYSHDESNPNSLPHSAILDVREDSKHNLWMGTDGGGLSYFNRAENKFTNFKNDPNNEKTLSANSVLCQYIDADGAVWAGTWGGGVSVLNPATGEFQRLPFDLLRKKTAAITTSNRLNNAHVWSIKEDAQKNLWMATHAGGLSKYDRKTQTYTHYVSIDSDPTSISSGIVWDTLEDSKGRFWVGTGSGLELMDKTTGKFTHFKTNPKIPNSLSNPSVLILFEDSKHRLWFGTEAGLDLLNADEKTFTVFNETNGLANGYIRSIVEDPAGQLWISTNNGISVLDPDTKKIKNYNRVNGRLMGAFHTDAGLFSSQGEILFGGVEGLRLFNIKHMTENQAVPSIAFTGLKIFADSVAVGGPQDFLQKSLNYTQSLVFDYKKSMFQFDFSALNFRDSNKNKYAYKLEGFDKDWLQVGDQRTAKYTNLNAGTYVFHVKGSNNDGIWNNEGISMVVVQLPPPWKTWWAYTIYALAVLGLIVWFVLQQRAKRLAIEQQNRVLEAKVSERTAELRHKNHDIQAMLENMPQGLFTVQEGELIHPEYSRALEGIFETKTIAGTKASDLLFKRANLGSDAYNSAVNALFAIVGEDEMSFGFNEPLLPHEYTLQFGSRKKYLALDWSPIIIDDVIGKLMVSVRDITELKEMETESLAQKRELDIISQLIKMSSEKMLGFEESALRFLQDNFETIERTHHRNEEVIAHAFRNMHTVKGNCRTFGFTHLSDVVHEVESVYSALRNNPELPWNASALLDDIERVRKVLSEYSDVFRNVLGRGDRTDANHDGFWMNNDIMNKIQAFSSNADIPGLQAYISVIQSKPLEDVLVDVVASLSGIASQLGKPTPIVRFDAARVRIKNTSFELMCDIFSHLLRNCIDHGIESREQRIQSDKNAQGHIFIRALPMPDRLNIFVSDDGRGLDLERLIKKGIERRAWPHSSSPSKQEIADLVFCSGVSTKEAITDISGRGVGLDAVKKFVQGQGGNIQLVLNDVLDSTNGFIAFELVISFPRHVFIEA